jgi:hypothetical protein
VLLYDNDKGHNLNIDSVCHLIALSIVQSGTSFNPLLSINFFLL